MNNKKYKTLILIIVVLLIANIATLIILLPGKNRKEWKRNEAFETYLKEKVGFSKEQLQVYDSLFDSHRSALKNEFEKTDSLRKISLKTIAAYNFSDSIIEASAKNNIGFHQQMHIQMMSHLKAIRNICTPPQQQIFDTSFYNVINKRKNNKQK